MCSWLISIFDCSGETNKGSLSLNILFNSSCSKPKFSKFILSFCRSINSKFNNSLSHFDSSATLLSAILYALTCWSVSLSAIIHGTCFMPNFLAAKKRVCPTIIIFSLSKTMGC